jgi:hypothetical protein
MPMVIGILGMKVLVMRDTARGDHVNVGEICPAVHEIGIAIYSNFSFSGIYQI